MLEIQMERCLLVLSEQDLMKCLALKPDIFEAAIGRGKGKIRHETVIKRQLESNARGFDRWKLYETLKGNIEVNNNVLAWIEGMDTEEMREGILEYLTTKSRQPG